MSYLLLLLLVLVFVLGIKGTAELSHVLSDVQQRRNLLARVAGFFAISAWLHALPTILIVVYMREEGMLAAEILAHDDARATIVGLYAMPIVALTVIVASWGAIWSFFFEQRWTLDSEHTIGGLGIALSLLIAVGVVTESFWRVVYLGAIVAPLTIYLTLALTTPLTTQIRLYWIPFAVVFAVSLTIIMASGMTHQLVSGELRRFNVGGGKWVVVKDKDFEIEGRLILLSEKTAYVRGMLDTERSSSCIVRLPTEHATVATTAVTPWETKWEVLNRTQIQLFTDRLGLPDYAEAISARAKAAGKTTRQLCGNSFGTEEWLDVANKGYQNLSVLEQIKLQLEFQSSNSSFLTRWIPDSLLWLVSKLQPASQRDAVPAESGETKQDAK